MPTQQNITLNCKGLYTFPNLLGGVPDGALIEASNVNIDHDGVINPRRGFDLYGNDFGTSSDTAKQLLYYKGRILRHWTTHIDVDSDGNGTFTNLSTSISEPTAGTRIKYIEANGNLYFTSSTGIQKLSALTASDIADETIAPAGGIPALDGTATLNSTIGWFTQDSAVAYRILWGTKDNNTNVIEGVPSERIVIYNSQLALMINDYNNLCNDLASCVSATPPSLSGTVSTSSPTITGLSSTSDLSVGMTVSGTDIPANTTLTAIGSTTVTMSANATGNNTGTITFGQALHNTNYGSLILPVNTSAQTLYQALINLANGPSNILDTDIGDQAYQVTTLTCSAGSSYPSTNSSDYFDIWNALNTYRYRVWFQAGTSIAPELPLNTSLVQVAVLSGDTATDVAVKVVHALNNVLNPITNVADFSSTNASGVVTITNTTYGVANTPVYYGSGSTLSVVLGTTPVFANIPLQPTNAPDNPASTGELIQMQTYFDAIINALNVSPGIGIYALNTLSPSRYTNAADQAFTNSTQSVTVDLKFTIPSVVTTDDFYQIYRSAIFSSSTGSTLYDISPDDELQLIFEGNPDATDLSNKYISFFDDVPDSFRAGGAYLYTNANSGEGITQANNPPPLAQDIALFMNCTFYANTQSVYDLQLGLLTAIGLPGGAITVAQGNVSNTYNFVIPQVTEINTIPQSEFVSSGTSDYFTIYSGQNATEYVVWFQNGSSIAPSVPGATLIEVVLSSGDNDATVATKLSSALANNTDFTVSSFLNTVTLTNTLYGATTTPTSNVLNLNFTVDVLTSGVGSSGTVNPVIVSTAATPAQQVDATARNIVAAINQNASEVIYAYYTSGVSDLPGLIDLQARTLGGNPFYITGSNNTISQAFNPDFGTINSITGISAANPTVITSASHGLSTGDVIIISGSDSTPSIDGIYTITKTGTNTFTIPVHVTSSGTTAGWQLLSDAFIATNDVCPNRLFYSKYQQPEAVPLVNYQDIGQKDQAILRILPLRTSLIILKQDGVYVLSGTEPSNFQIQLFDSSTQIKAPDSAVVLNNQVFLFGNQGITSISDTGISVVSRPIENSLIPLLTSQYTNFIPATFAISYESDRSYVLFTLQNTSDEVATIAYRWNTFTTTWTSWDVSKTCGVVDILQDVMYLGAADTNYIEQERKTFTRLDQADRTFQLSVPNNGVNGTTVNLGATFNITPGDVLSQTQYLTISQFNRLLRQLDTDTGLNQQGTYYTDLNVVAGVDLFTAVGNLATKLDSDSGLAAHGYVAAISSYTDTFPDTQAAFNVITNKLNMDSNTQVKTYPTSSGTVTYESIVTAVNNMTFNLTMNYAPPFLVGVINHLESIDSIVTWAPHHFGDASMLKHISESTILFSAVDFTQATARYSSDLAPGFTPIPVYGEGNGAWGLFEFGNVNWGGSGASYPFRTFVPVNQQRCRYINGQFEHNTANESYSIFGISYTFVPVSSRAYR